MKRRKAVIAIIESDDQVLVGKKIANPEKFLSSMWYLPGGKAEYGVPLLQSRISRQEMIYPRLSLYRKIK